jgi:acetyltransferase
MEFLKSVFSPSSIAVIGASSKEGKVGNAIFTNILFNNFKGVIYPINPTAKSINGVKCYASLQEIKDNIDLAVVIVPAVSVPDVLEECGSKNIKGAIVVSAGFKEIGKKEGIDLENQVKEIIKKYKIQLIGPNCLGVINTEESVSMNATFAKSMPKAGNIAFVSQSGALCTAVLDYTKGENIGFSKFISMGNKAGISENELLMYLKDDPQTDVILMYLEDLVDGRKFIEIAREITGELKKCKPILAIKSGRTPQGAKAASSHTGSLAGSDEVYDAIFSQSGVLRVDSVEDLFDKAIAFSRSPLPKGNKVAIVTNAGGPGIMTTDACIRYGLELASLGDDTKKELKEHLPPTANVNNPVDVIGDAQFDRYEAALTSVMKDKNVDGIIIILTPQAMVDIENVAKVVVKSANMSKDGKLKKEKPVFACFMGIVDVSVGVKVLEEGNIPTYKFPEEAVRALSSMVDYTKWLVRPRTQVKVFDVDKNKVAKIFEKVLKEKRKYLPEYEAVEVFKAYGLNVAKSKLAKDVEECIKAANEIGYPVVMKISSPDIIHKFDVSGVKLNLSNETQVKNAFNEMVSNVKKFKPDATIWGVLIQEMSGKGIETIIGVKRDHQFGPIIMFGLGGIYVETLKDVTFRVAPVKELGASKMVESIKAHKILEGLRGNPPSDMRAISNCIERISQLVMDFDNIEELDINPLVVFEKGKGCKVLDGRILIN